MGFIGFIVICGMLWSIGVTLDKINNELIKANKKPKTNNSYKYFGVRKK